MKTSVERKLFMGIGGFMIPIPRMIASRGLQKGVSGAKAKAELLSTEERKIHHFIVKKIAVAQKPITTEIVSEELGVPAEKVESTIDKLEGLKTFLYRSDGLGINWAYPHSLENTGHKMIANTGEHFFAAWAIDAFATPFVYGRLQNRTLTFTIHTECANSGRQIEIKLDSELNITRMTEGADPMYSMALINTDKMKEASIVDIFWRRSVFFWSEEDARKYQKKTRQQIFYMNITPVSLEGIKKVQSAIFGFWKWQVTIVTGHGWRFWEQLLRYLVKHGFLIVWFGCIKIYAQKTVNIKVGCTERLNKSLLLNFIRFAPDKIDQHVS